jgi:regulator of protease activity HflC (stomatin/prohibitin superfamily)
MTREKTITVIDGWLMLVVTIAVFFAGIGLEIGFGFSAHHADITHTLPNLYLLFGGIMVIALGSFMCYGFITLQPNEARVIILFGAYKGTVRTSGFLWTNPLNTKRRISLRSRNLNGQKLKVNDKRGNPIEIATVIVWRVEDTAQACFDVENYENYVTIQSESALRHLASSYAYDHGNENEQTLQASVDEISVALQKELQERASKAGVLIEEARLSHLAYAPEIAQVMLRRQQAEAIIDARQKIVHGAVTMVQMALQELAEKGIVQLDEERKATMVGNLLVVLCGEAEVQPIVNTGTLYT